LLYLWRRKYRAGGAEVLRMLGRQTNSVALPEAPRPCVDATDPAAAQSRIDELERKIGQQQMELDFFRAALRHVRERRL
jgi:transposase